MMKKTLFTVEKCERLTSDVFDLYLSGDTSELSQSGQFVNIDVPGLYLRRPISVCDFDKQRLRLVFKVVGKGTRIMSGLSKGEKLDLLLPLGNGFDVTVSGQKPYLVGGGVGVPPLLHLAKELRSMGKRVKVILGFNTKMDCILYDDFCEIVGRDNVIVTTVDGSFGAKGFVTDIPMDDASYVYSCGPIPMLKNVAKKTNCGAELSLESRMGCGFGACMGCSIHTTDGPKRVCKEGPVFKKEVIVW